MYLIKQPEQGVSDGCTVERRQPRMNELEKTEQNEQEGHVSVVIGASVAKARLQSASW